jgi:inorganic pyrophosphatase
MAETNTFKTDELKQKVQHVISLYTNIKNEKEALVDEKIQLLRTIEEQQVKIAEIENNYKNLQIAKAVSTKDEGESDFAKKRIDAIVREIDKCIALLNK